MFDLLHRHMHLLVTLSAWRTEGLKTIFIWEREEGWEGGSAAPAKSRSLTHRMKTSSTKAPRTMLMVCWYFLCSCYIRWNKSLSPFSSLKWSFGSFVPFDIANSCNLKITISLSGFRGQIYNTLEIQSGLWLSHVVVLFPVSLKVVKAAMYWEVFSAGVMPIWWSLVSLFISSLVL